MHIASRCCRPDGQEAGRALGDARALNASSALRITRQPRSTSYSPHSSTAARVSICGHVGMVVACSVQHVGFSIVCVGCARERELQRRPHFQQQAHAEGLPEAPREGREQRESESLALALGTQSELSECAPDIAW